MFRRKQTQNHLQKSIEVDAVIADFFEKEYLAMEYIVPVDIDSALKNAADTLADSPGFRGIVNVGSTANGSLELRRRTGGKSATDLDFYLVGTSDLNIVEASQIVQKAMRPLHMSLDGALNGLNEDNFLNIDALDEIIDRGDSALLALAFQSYYGIQQTKVQKQILEEITKRLDEQEVWNTVASFHVQSLSLHHGSFSPELSNTIMDEIYPQKVARFELAETAEEVLHYLRTVDF